MAILGARRPVCSSTRRPGTLWHRRRLRSQLLCCVCKRAIMQWGRPRRNPWKNLRKLKNSPHAGGNPTKSNDLRAPPGSFPCRREVSDPARDDLPLFIRRASHSMNLIIRQPSSPTAQPAFRDAMSHHGRPILRPRFPPPPPSPPPPPCPNICVSKPDRHIRMLSAAILAIFSTCAASNQDV